MNPSVSVAGAPGVSDAVAMDLAGPLFTAWDEQYVVLTIPRLALGAAVSLEIDGEPAAFQYTGKQSAAGAEVMFRAGWKAGQRRRIEFVPSSAATTDLSRIEVPADEGAAIGEPERLVQVPPIGRVDDQFNGPLAGFAGFPIASRLRFPSPESSSTPGTPASQLVSRRLFRTHVGPLFLDYELTYTSADGRRYALRFRCFRDEPMVEVTEIFGLGMGAELELSLNPGGALDRVISRDSFEGEPQPTVEPLVLERPNDLLCRLQIPVIGDYYVPTNRPWLALFDSRDEARGMIGILGLYGARWVNPVENMPRIYVDGGRASLRASLRSGERYWMLYAGPVQKTYTAEQRFVFHRLHAQFNALRLDEHFDLAGDAIFDASCWDKPGYLGPDYREKARRNAEALPILKARRSDESLLTLRALLDPDPKTQDSLLTAMLARFEKWVRQFQGFCTAEHDYGKSVIGFARQLRHWLIAYELLRKDGRLSNEQVRRLNAYFVFAARRIVDEGRWPHSKTWLHPDHPESTRDVYTYGGEHKPDRLVWTNCLPNFQSDPLCALLHLAALIPDHPDSPHWQRFAIDDIERQLDAYCGKSGAWEESINYALFTLSYFVVTFRIVKHRLGIDYFQDPRVRRFMGWLVRVFGPLDKRFNVYTFPGVGNVRVPTQEGELLLAYAGELEEGDPLRADLISVYQMMENDLKATEERVLIPAAVMAPIPDRRYPLRPLSSEWMDELGVAMRHEHPSPKQSYLFQKIGFWKDHYEDDETSFNWYAKGTPLCMDYGTYTPGASGGHAHNLVEIPDADALRRGYLAESFFSTAVDFTRSEVPVSLKLLHGRIRTFAEIDGPPVPSKFFYIGDENPAGPKLWKVRQLLFVKPDYVLIFDRVFGAVPHRYNLHVTADKVHHDGATITARGRFDLDLRCFVQHPREFEFQTGELIPGGANYPTDHTNPHRQSFFRINNKSDGVYRTLLFAEERGREVSIERAGEHGVKVTTPEYTDYAFANDGPVTEAFDGVRFEGRVGWIRRWTDGRVAAAVISGDVIEAFDTSIRGRGPWTYNLVGRGEIDVRGVPRTVICLGK